MPPVEMSRIRTGSLAALAEIGLHEASLEVAKRTDARRSTPAAAGLA
jgi:hypothetical protein